jgi:hypothetical protein
MVRGLEVFKKKGLLKQAFDVSEVNRNESITNDYQAVYQNEQNNQWPKVVIRERCRNQLPVKEGNDSFFGVLSRKFD